MDGMFDYFAALSEANTKIYPDDYKDDEGLIHCRKCGGAKQSKHIINGVEHIVTHMCDCQKAEYDREQAEIRLRQFQAEQARRKSVAFPDSEYRDWSFAMDDGGNPECSRIAKAYAENFREMYKMGKGLLLYGSVGTGKSFYASCIVNYIMENYYYPCLMTNMTRIASAVQSMKDPQAYLDTLNEYDLLVLDDLRAERDTPWMNELVHSVINSRYMSGKPLIVTTNLTREEIAHPEDRNWQRIYSRLYEMCRPTEVRYKDRRKEALRKSRDDMDRILGLID